VRWDRRYQQLRGLKLARHLKAKGIEVLEVEHPKRRWLAVTKLSAEIAELDATRSAGEASRPGTGLFGGHRY
jgi:predicted nuclease with RNAse H fold